MTNPDQRAAVGAILAVALIASCGSDLELDQPIPQGPASSDDSTPPTWPSGSRVWTTSAGQSHVALRWDRAHDETRVVGYRVIENGNPVVDVQGTAALLTLLKPGTDHTLTIEARDAAGNWSTTGPTVSAATTASCGAGPLR